MAASASSTDVASWQRQEVAEKHVKLATGSYKLLNEWCPDVRQRRFTAVLTLLYLDANILSPINFLLSRGRNIKL